MKKLLNKKKWLAPTLISLFLLSGIALPKHIEAREPTNAEIVAACQKYGGGTDAYGRCANQLRAQYKAAETGGIPPDKIAQQGPTWWDTLVCNINPFDCALRNLVATIASAILELVSLLTRIGGLVLNGVIFHTVINVSKNYENLPAINEAWKVIRDVANMAFIFVLLYAAIQTILGIGKDTQRLIVRVVVVAILINFSLFFTKFVIDISNVLSLTFYDAIVPGAAEKGLLGIGLADAFMNNLNLQSLYSVAEGGTVTFGKILSTGIMGSIMLLIASFVFFAVALMFIIRYVVLILVLILSPIAFIAFILPQAEKYRGQWVDALIGQAFFAPIYFMLTWVTIKILGGITKANIFQANGPLANVSTSDTGFIGTFINYIVVIVFLIVSLVIAKEWAGKAPGGVGKLTSWAMGAAGGATLGMAGRFSRGTVGRAGQAVAENEWLKSKAPTSMLARLGLAASRKTAGASFDVRNLGVAGALDAGKGQKGGFAGDLKKKIEDQKKYADSLKPSEIITARADKELEEAKKTGDATRIKNAQAEVDRLKGANEEEMRKREIKKMREEAFDRNEYLSEKEARKRLEIEENRRRVKIKGLKAQGQTHDEAVATAKNMSREESGWAPEVVKGVTVERKEAYAKDKETSVTFNIPIINKPISFTGRVGLVGKVKRERLEEANAIRKSTKEKKPAEKIAEQIKTEAEAAVDSTGGQETAPPTPPAPTPTGPTP